MTVFLSVKVKRSSQRLTSTLEILLMTVKLRPRQHAHRRNRFYGARNQIPPKNQHQSITQVFFNLCIDLINKRWMFQSNLSQDKLKNCFKSFKKKQIRYFTLEGRILFYSALRKSNEVYFL